MGKRGCHVRRQLLGLRARHYSGGADILDAEESRIEAATEQALETVSDSSFADYGDTGECTEDCSGHEAGYEWAKDREVEDEVDCSGNSESFIDGCRAYARARESAVEDAVDAAEY